MRTKFVNGACNIGKKASPASKRREETKTKMRPSLPATSVYQLSRVKKLNQEGIKSLCLMHRRSLRRQTFRAVKADREQPLWNC